MKRPGEPRGIYKKLTIDRIDLVDRGANPGAFVTIVKRDAEPITPGGSKGMNTISVTKAEALADDRDEMLMDHQRRNPGESLLDAENALLGVMPGATSSEVRKYAALLTAEQEAREAAEVAKVAEPPEETVASIAWAKLVTIVSKKYGLRSGEADPRFATSFADALASSDRSKELYGILRHDGAELAPADFAERYGRRPIAKLYAGGE